MESKKQEFINKWIIGEFANAPRYPEVIETFTRELEELMKPKFKPLEWINLPIGIVANSGVFYFIIREIDEGYKASNNIIYKTLEEAKAAAEKEFIELFNQMIQLS